MEIGENVMVAGLAMQLTTFSFFFLILLKFHLLTRNGVSDAAGSGWRKILMAVYISSGMIIVRPTPTHAFLVSVAWLTFGLQIRCIFRLIEFALGIFGYPFTHEWIFYTLEAIPMLPAIIVFCVWHPGKYFGAGGRRGGKSPKALTEIPLTSSDSRV